MDGHATSCRRTGLPGLTRTGRCRVVGGERCRARFLTVSPINIGSECLAGGQIERFVSSDPYGLIHAIPRPHRVEHELRGGPVAVGSRPPRRGRHTRGTPHEHAAAQLRLRAAPPPRTSQDDLWAAHLCVLGSSRASTPTRGGRAHSILTCFAPSARPGSNQFSISTPGRPG